jgi:hypothetical protein
MPVNNPLVPVTLVNCDSDKSHPASRPDSGFIAHLIATKAKAPQTRTRRRVELGEAISAYAELGQRPSAAGRTLSRSL